MTAVAVAAAVIVVTASTPVIAHSQAELDDWLAGWIDIAVPAMSVDELVEWTDMASRHPRYFGRAVPHTHRYRIYGDRVERWRPLVAQYFPAGQVDRALRVMACESGGYSRAANPTSSARGLFQHLGKYWATRSAAAGFAGASIFDPEANVATAAWLLKEAGWGSWVCR